MLSLPDPSPSKSLLSLPAPSPSRSPRPPPPPPSQKHATPVSLSQIVISKQAVNSENRPPQTPNNNTKTSVKQPILLQTEPRRTNPLIWFGAVVCLVFSLLLIFFGIATLIIFLVVKPRTPVFDTPNARLNTVYFDSPDYFNGDFAIIANFSNPNRKLDVRFEYVDIELYFADRLISTQALQPFTQPPGEIRLEAVHLISSLVYLPQNHAVELRTQVQSNRVNYNIRGTFKVRATLGMIHVTYWLHSRCQLQMTGPPTGILVARNCRTKR
ncbi:Late embryogenesis abundant protein [Parasponia andersonii]|uniref:Late embryogenesis abundant protein n=1 Tax=Parasponia andersonii TaxID=3476 RepID=A0A2P5AYS6_PARAD|nr:Late embryogenesis abundant protein [Parasponia andersonii]